jgi:4-diphosphocytidyl-2-C-methyl-D-erythritol kinase
MTTVGLFDTLIIYQPAASVESDTVWLSCDLPGLPADDRNLVTRIARAWHDEMRLPSSARVRIDLQKQIPMGAGLGGGSSDAAHALLGVNWLWRTGRAANDLSAFAARFGSDLSFFFFGASSICRGRGEIVTPLARPKACWAVLVLPGLSMPTPHVYRRFDELGLGRHRDIDDTPPFDDWTRLSSEELLPLLVNDLERPAFDIAPALGSFRGRLERTLGRPVRMSGSGSSLFTLFDNRDSANDAADRILRNENEKAIAVELAPSTSSGQVPTGADDHNKELARK